MNEENSNIDEWIENLPDSLVTSTSIEVNPLGDISSGNDFIYTDQALEANLEVDLPLCVSLDNILLRDTLEIDVNSTDKIDGLIKIFLNNAFPLDGELNLKIVSDEDEEGSYLLESGILESGITTDFYSVQATENYFEVAINESVLDELSDSGKIAVEILLNSYNNDFVKFTDANFIDISVYLDAELKSLTNEENEEHFISRFIVEQYFNTGSRFVTSQK